MRRFRTPSSRAVRVSALLCCLVGLAATLGTEARSASQEPRGTSDGPLDDWEPATVRFERPKGTAGGVSDADDWLG